MFHYIFQSRWWPWHLLCACVVAALAFLGYWQMSVAFNPGEWHQSNFSIRNFVYALQWWVFAIFGVWFWYRYMRDQRDSELGVAAEDQAIARAKVATDHGVGSNGSSKSAAEGSGENTVEPISLDMPADERRRQIYGERSKETDETQKSDGNSDRDTEEKAGGDKGSVEDV